MYYFPYSNIVFAENLQQLQLTSNPLSLLNLLRSQSNMSTVSILLILVSCIMITSSASSSKSKDKKRKSSGDTGDDSSEYTTSTTIAPGNTSITATSTYNEALCDCFDIDLVCGPIEIEDQICYHYRIADISTASNCSDPITSITFGYGNLAECNLTVSDIEDTILDYAPSCYTLDTNDDDSLIDGVTIVLDTETVTYSVSDSSSSGSIVSGSSSDSSEVDDISIVASLYFIFYIFYILYFIYFRNKHTMYVQLYKNCVQ